MECEFIEYQYKTREEFENNANINGKLLKDIWNEVSFAAFMLWIIHFGYKSWHLLTPAGAVLGGLESFRPKVEVINFWSFLCKKLAPAAVKIDAYCFFDEDSVL